ncbi:hypothetical protein CSKR_113673 [Clonorchis sinensis]|uniref:PEHE domain-containing protein n=1 Tax=Clonorchis sinensis TaxID=79923 RepID=A0A8T1LWN8_CLOSI|nr:hypothetical protein CSKR_113673 [Clonorchis sinensis]
MVTAVEQNMVGILRRFHLHSMDAAFNEFNSQNPLTHLRKFNPHPFLFKTHTELESTEQVKRFSAPSSTLPINDSKLVRQTRRHSRLSHGYEHPSRSPLHHVEQDSRISTVYSPDRHRSSSMGSNLSNPGALQRSLDEAPPTLYTPTPTYGKRSATGHHGTPSLLDHPPTLSNPRTPASGNPPVTNWEHSKIEPILSTTASLLEGRTPLSRIAPISHMSSDRIRTSSGNSHGETLSDATESTTSMPNVSAGAQTLIEHNSYPAPPHNTGCQLRPRSGTKMTTTSSSSVASKLLLRSKRRALPSSVELSARHLSPKTTSKPLKRRRSFDQLTEPSIHGSPDPTGEHTHRERRPTQFLQIPPSSPTSSIRVQRQGPIYLRTANPYYLPDFSILCTSSGTHEQILYGERLVEEDEGNLDDEHQSVTSLIEVPSWRINPLSAVVRSLEDSRTRHRQNTNDSAVDPHDVDESNSDPIVKTLRTGVIRSSGVVERRFPERLCPPEVRLSGSSVRTSGSSVAPSPSSEISDLEDTSDAAYQVRHARLELEEIRRERRCRQRTFEQELKQRIEQRDRESWRKRQPGRLDPLAKLNPEDRMPSHLNLAFNQIQHFRVCDTIPVVAFGACIPASSFSKIGRLESVVGRT